MERNNDIEDLLKDTTPEEREKIYRLAALIAERIFEEEKARKKAKKAAKKAKDGKRGKDGKSGADAIVVYGGQGGNATCTCSVNVYDGVNVSKSKSQRTTTPLIRDNSPEGDLANDVLRVAKMIGNVFSMLG